MVRNPARGSMVSAAWALAVLGAWTGPGLTADPADPAARLQELEAVLAETPALQPQPLGRSRPASLASVDCQGLSHTQKVTMMFLQGLANRQGPRLLLEGLDAQTAVADRQWLRHLEAEYGIACRAVHRHEALTEFGGELDGVVVWDPAVPATENVAGMLGSLLSRLPCAPVDLDEVTEATGLPLTCDLRGMWGDPVTAQAWALDQVAAKLSTEEIGCIINRAVDVRLCRDWLIMRGAPMIDLSSAIPEERALKDQYFARMPWGGIVWGWMTLDADQHVEHASRHGLRCICATTSPNISFLARIQPTQTSWTQPKGESWGVTEDKVYIAFVLSAGDTASVMLTRQHYRWDEAARGTVPFAWEMQPLFADLAPVVLEFYYSSASPLDRFICGPSGAGYAQLTLLPDVGVFVAQTAEACGTCDLGVVGLHTAFHQDLAEVWARHFPTAKGFAYGWDGQPEQPPRIVHGQPHLYYGLMPPAPEETKDDAYYGQVASQVREYAEQRGMPCVLLVHMYQATSGPDDVPRIMDALGDFPAEVVPIDSAMEIAARILAEAEPGTEP